MRTACDARRNAAPTELGAVLYRGILYTWRSYGACGHSATDKEHVLGLLFQAWSDILATWSVHRQRPGHKNKVLTNQKNRGFCTSGHARITGRDQASSQSKRFSGDLRIIGPVLGSTRWTGFL